MTPTQLSPSSIAFRAFAEEVGAFSRHLQAENKSPRTIQVYGESASLLGRYLHAQGMPLDLEAIRGEHIEAWLVELLGKFKPATVSVRYRSLQAFWKWAVAEGLVRESPMRNIAAPVIPEELTPSLEEGELQRLLRAVEKDRSFEGKRDHALLRLMIETGGRLAEITGIRYQPDLEDEHDLRLDRKEVRLFGKGKRWRIVPYSSATGRALDRYLRARRAHRHESAPALWLARKGPMTPSGVSQAVKRRGAEVGLKVRPHLLRHTAADRFLTAGGDAEVLMPLMGWNSRTMLQRYASKRRAARAAEQWREKVPEL